jgi:hypothetical protein
MTFHKDFVKIRFGFHPEMRNGPFRPARCLRGFPAAAYRCTSHRKPLCGLDRDKKLLISELDTN